MPNHFEGIILNMITGKKKLKQTNSREVNPYRKKLLLQAFFAYTRTLLKTQKSVKTLLFISDEHIIKQSKKRMLQNNISI